MANEVKWKAGTSRTTGIAASSLNAGANVLGSAIDNATNLDRFFTGELVFTCGTAPGTNEAIELYLLYALDGSTYEDGDATPTDPVKQPIAQFGSRAVTSSQRVTVTNLPLAPYPFKILLKSELTQNATVTCTCKTHNEDIQ